MLNQLLPPSQLVHAGETRVVAGRTEAQESAVVVVAQAGQRRALAALLGLHCEIVEIDLPERTVVEPVVTHPAIDHRALRCGHLQCRVRVGQRHHHGEALVRRAEHADLAIALRHVLDQPVDGVPGVGGVVHLGVVQRPAQRPGHHVIAFGAVLAADVLEHADVTAVDEHLVALRQQVAHARRIAAAGAAGGIVGGAGQQDRRIVGALGHHDHRIQPGAITHRHHHHALVVVTTDIGGNEGLAADVRGHRRGIGGQHSAGQAKGNGYSDGTHTHGQPLPAGKLQAYSCPAP